MVDNIETPGYPQAGKFNEELIGFDRDLYQYFFAQYIKKLLAEDEPAFIRCLEYNSYLHAEEPEEEPDMRRGVCSLRVNLSSMSGS